MTTKELRDLNVWIAEKVMNVKPEIKSWAANKDESAGVLFEDWAHGITRKVIKDFCKHHPDYHLVEMKFYPRYTTDPVAAMAVLERCAKITIVRIRSTQNGFVVFSSSAFGAEVETLPLAIALFARNLFGGK